MKSFVSSRVSIVEKWICCLLWKPEEVVVKGQEGKKRKAEMGQDKESGKSAFYAGASGNAYQVRRTVGN